MERASFIGSVISLLVGIGLQLSGWQSLPVAIACWVLAAILLGFGVFLWWRARRSKPLVQAPSPTSPKPKGPCEGIGSNRPFWSARWEPVTAEDVPAFGNGILLHVEGPAGDEFVTYFCDVRGPEGRYRDSHRDNKVFPNRQPRTEDVLHFPGEFKAVPDPLPNGSYCVVWYAQSGTWLGGGIQTTHVASSSFKVDGPVFARIEDHAGYQR